MEKISTEGDKESSKLQSQSPKEKVKTSKKPQGKKKFGAANTVFVSDKDNAQQELVVIITIRIVLRKDKN